MTIGTTGEGAAAEAIRAAEAALARQQTLAAHVDLQVVTALLNAHTTHAEGAGALAELQRDIEAAVVTRPDLDTAAGARSFQRFLIDRVRDIRAVVDGTELDVTSKASAAAALAALYSTAENDSAAIESAAAPPDADAADLLAEGLPPDVVDLPVDLPNELPPAPSPPAAGIPAPGMPVGTGGLPSLSGPSGLPLSGSSPTGLPLSGSSPTGLPLSGSSPIGSTSLADLLPRRHRPDTEQTNDHPDRPGPDEPDPDEPPNDSAGAPDDALRPELPAVISAAVAGTPIAEAFAGQGIAIPAAGTPVAAPLPPEQVTAGDIGVFTDRHALALGNGKALLDNQIEPVAEVSGAGFLGWQHPPRRAEPTTNPVARPAAAAG